MRELNRFFYLVKTAMPCENMHRMKRITLFASTLLAALVGTAFAADTAEPSKDEPRGEATIPHLRKPPRPSSKLLNLPPVEANKPRIDIDTFLAWPKEVGDAQVALWRGNAIGALSLTNDDNHWARDPRWLEISEKYPAIKMTQFVHGPTEKVSEEDKAAWRKLVELGHEVQAHTYTHPSAARWDELTVEEMRRELEGPIRLIEEAIPGHKVIVNAGCPPKWPQLHADHYAANRASAGFPNRADIVDYMRTASYSGMVNPTIPRHGPNTSTEAIVKSLYDTDYTFWGHKYHGAWSCVHFHGFGPQGELEGILDEFILPAQKENKIWVARFSDVILYAQSRDTSKLELTRNKPTEIAFVLTDLMDDEIYNRPLTIKVRVPDDWKTVTAKQADKPIEAKLVEHEGKKFAFVEAVPDRGETVITPQ